MTEAAHARTSSGPLLEVEDLRVGFGGRDPVEVVRGVSFVLAPGEACGIVGESGSGKSTLAAALVRLLPAGGRILGGSVRLGGADVGALSERELRALRGRRVAVVFQEAATALDPLMTIGAHLREALLLARGLRGRAARRDALGLAQEVGLSDPERRLRQYPHELSGGMRQRVLIALALAGDPELLIADEPTTALDVTVQAQILALLHARQQERGMSLILISHALPVVSSVVDRVLVLYAGRLAEAGNVRELFAAPRHPYTAALLASNPDVDADRELRPIPGAPPRPGEMPDGCPFAPRCAYSLEACRIAPPPPAVRIAAGRELACPPDPLAAA